MDRQGAGELPEFRRGVARGIATARPGARGALLALIEDKAQPAIVRASAIARLGRWLTPAMRRPWRAR